MSILAYDRILEVHKAAIDANLSGNRDALLSGIHLNIIAALSAASAPGGQLLSDLGILNDAGIMADGTVPLATWLQNASALAAPRKEVAIFDAAFHSCPRVVPPPPQSTAHEPFGTPGAAGTGATVVKVELRLARPLRAFDERALLRELSALLGSQVTGIHITSIREGSVIVTIEGDPLLLRRLVEILSAGGTQCDIFAGITGLVALSWISDREPYVQHARVGAGAPRTTDASERETAQRNLNPSPYTSRVLADVHKEFTMTSQGSFRHTLADEFLKAGWRTYALVELQEEDDDGSPDEAEQRLDSLTRLLYPGNAEDKEIAAQLLGRWLRKSANAVRPQWLTFKLRRILCLQQLRHCQPAIDELDSLFRTSSPVPVMTG